ncbi:MAG: LTA synthase family protein [Chitinophagaceae bacterium]|nr:LTA synthase family protein [Chitinophagaceae bacterium]
MPTRVLHYFLVSGIFFLLLMSILRLVFHLVFQLRGDSLTIDAILLGLRYDARVVGVYLFLLWVPGLFNSFRPFQQKAARIYMLGLGWLLGLLIILLYTFDFAHFAYLRQRLNASVLSYTADAGISLTMVWQSYPVIKILLVWIAAFCGLWFVMRYLYRYSSRITESDSRRKKGLVYFVSFLVIGVAIFGKIGKFPLRWSDAYRFGNDYQSNLCLNPFQSFASSFKFRNAGFDLQRTRYYYPLITKAIGIHQPDTGHLSFRRNIVFPDSHNLRKPNIVLVICESFSAYKSSMWGNPLNTTPYFDSLCREGYFFKNCFSPAYGTARGIWSIITGIPDVSEIKTASRNLSMVDQRNMLNDIREYEKMYFIGGSASWANIRGVLKGNIAGLRLYEQQDYHSPALNVWGISDKNLFLEANEVLKQETKPFIAVIQTAYNHRPYTIPKEDEQAIKLRSFPKDTLEKYGFWSDAEMNAFGYMDYTFKVFMQAAAREKYFMNTLFVFVGDHGIRGNAGNMMPKVWTDQGLTTQHVPLLFYAPWLSAGISDKKVSQVDIIPSVCHLAGIPVSNYSLGRDLFYEGSDSSLIGDHSFVTDPDQKIIGLVSHQYFYRYELLSGRESVYSLLDNRVLSPKEPGDSLLQMMRNLTLGYYETSRYLLLNNRK